jgi:hypothetical protein
LRITLGDTMSRSRRQFVRESRKLPTALTGLGRGLLDTTGVKYKAALRMA